MISLDSTFLLASSTPTQEAKFFASIRLSNGTFKTTADHRMDDLNAFVAAQWRTMNAAPTEILDVGASSGISTMEWLETLTRDGFKVRMTATDLTLWAEIVPLLPGFEVLIEESRRHVLRHIVLGIPLRPWSRRLDRLTGYVVLTRLANLIAKHRLRLAPRPRERVILVSQRALRCGGIVWAQDDMLAPNPEQFLRRFDAIRAANVLNRDYFGADDLRRAVSNLKARLSGPRACLIVNRTWNDGSNHATLFKLHDDDRFRIAARLGRGSEIEDIVLS